MFRMPKAIPTASKLPSGKGSAIGVGREEADAVGESLCGDLLPARGEHLSDEIDPRHPDVRSAAGGFDRQVGGAGRNVQKAECVEEMHLPDCEAAPGDIAAEAEEVVEEVVPPGDRGEDLPDHADVLIAADPVTDG